MIMSPALRKLVLTIHIVTSVAFPGAVASFLALALVGLASSDPQIVRAAYVAMGIIAWSVIVPLAFATLVVGVLSSMGTPWGLFRYYWIIAKLALTVPATALLMLHMRIVDVIATAAAKGPLAPELNGLQIQVAAYAGPAVLVLLLATALSVYKPRGVTRYGWRMQQPA